MTEQVLEFGGLSIAFDDEVLTPRAWTLAQSSWAADLLGELPDGPVLELCAGAGQIGLAATEGTGRALVQVDADERACAYARRNAEAAGSEAEVRCGDLEDALRADERFPLVLADPPYVPSDDVDDLPEDPELAIDGGDDGLDLARTCLRVAGAHLAPGGWILLPLGGRDQADTLAPEAAAWQLEVTEVRTYGDEGVVVALRRAEG